MSSLCFFCRLIINIGQYEALLDSGSRTPGHAGPGRSTGQFPVPQTRITSTVSCDTAFIALWQPHGRWIALLGALTFECCPPAAPMLHLTTTTLSSLASGCPTAKVQKGQAPQVRQPSNWTVSSGQQLTALHVPLPRACAAVGCSWGPPPLRSNARNHTTRQ